MRSRSVPSSSSMAMNGFEHNLFTTTDFDNTGSAENLSAFELLFGFQNFLATSRIPNRDQSQLRHPTQTIPLR